MHGPNPNRRINWDDLRLFLEIARAGTLTAAAARLDLSQPTAGRRLRALEKAVGAPLFQRTPSGHRLTDEGEAMLAHAENMEGDAIALERKLMGGAGRLEGMLRLSTSDWFANTVLAAPLAGFALDHPAMTVELVVDWRMSDLQRREADLVFRFVPFNSSEVVQRKFTHVRYGLYAHADYLARHGAPRTDDGGKGHRLIGLNSALDNAADVQWLGRQYPEARMVLRSNSREWQGRTCAGGAGLAVLPRVIGDALPVEMIANAEPPGRDIWLGYHTDLRRLRRLRALVDHLVGATPAQI
jgi:DNA-binding transcriptional LysR family regulator